MSSPGRRATSSSSASRSGPKGRKGGAGDDRKQFGYPQNMSVPAAQPIDVLFASQDVVRALAIPPGIAVKIAESAGTLFAASQAAQNAKNKSSGGGGSSRPGTSSTSGNSGGSGRAAANQAGKARSALQDALESMDGDAVGRMHHANLVVSTFSNAALVSSRQTQRQYESLYQGAKEEVVKLSTEMDERDRDAVRVVDFLRRELEQKHMQQQKLIQEHKTTLAEEKDKSEREMDKLRETLRDKERVNDTLQKEISRLQGELDLVAEFRRERVLLLHEQKRHAEAEELLTQKFEREITQLKFQNLEDRLRLRAVENQMCDKFQAEVHTQAEKLVDAKGRAIRVENEQLRDHTMRLHKEVEDLTNVVDTRTEELQHTQREVELSLQTQGEYARRGLMQSRTAKDAIEKVKVLQAELAAQSREAKAVRLEDKRAYEARIAALESKLDAAQASLLSHRRDLVKTRQLASRIVSQRSELEQFFYDALEYVAAERAREIEAAGGAGGDHIKTAQLASFLQQPPPTSAASSSAHRKTMTGELRVLPDQIRKVVTARRDIGYRGDLDANVVPGSDAGPAGSHRGLQAHSARRPPQGCFSAQPDFAVSRTSQTFMTQPAGMKSEFAPLPSHQQPPPLQPLSARKSQASGFLLEQRRLAEEETQQRMMARQEAEQQPQQQQAPSAAQQQPAVSRALTATSSSSNNRPGNSSGGSAHNSPRSQQQAQQQQVQPPVSALYPEMHGVMQESQAVASDFKSLAWYDKEKIICAMLYHLNRSTLRQAEDARRGRDSAAKGGRRVLAEEGAQQQQWSDTAGMQPVEFDDNMEVIDGLGDDPHGDELTMMRRRQQMDSQPSSDSGSRAPTADSGRRGAAPPRTQLPPVARARPDDISWDAQDNANAAASSARPIPKPPSSSSSSSRQQQQQQQQLSASAVAVSNLSATPRPATQGGSIEKRAGSATGAGSPRKQQ